MLAASSPKEIRMDESMVKIVAGVLCLACLGIIVMRRKGKKKSAAEDDF